jgi:hypothetical protein
LAAGDYVESGVFNCDTVTGSITTPEDISSFSTVWVVA